MLSSMPWRKSTIACKKKCLKHSPARGVRANSWRRESTGTLALSLLEALVNIYCIYVFLFLSMIPRGGTVLPRKFFYFPPFFLKKKTLTGKEDHSNDILTNFYCHSYTTSNQNLTTGGCTSHSLPQLTHILKHYFLWTTSSFTEKIKLLF